MKLYALAKVNLGLNIIGRRKDGYHTLQTLLLPISLADEIRIERRDKFQIHGPNFGEDDFMYQAYCNFSDYIGKNLAVDISITKNIPIGAGLAGGTTDGAAVFRAINTLYDLNFSLEELAHIAAPLGADFPYTIHSRPALGEGVGDFLTFLPAFQNLPIILLNPGFSISTQKAYELVKVFHEPLDQEEWIESLLSLDFDKMRKNLKNDLEPSLSVIYPVLEKMKQQLYQLGAQFVSLSGSGPTVFGIFESTTIRNQAYHQLRGCYSHVIQAEILGGTHE